MRSFAKVAVALLVVMLAVSAVSAKDTFLDEVTPDVVANEAEVIVVPKAHAAAAEETSSTTMHARTPSRGLRSAAGPDAMRFRERRAAAEAGAAAGDRRGFIDGVKKFAKGVAGVAKGVADVLLGAKKMRSEDIEDCVACRYIWLQVELEVGNSQVEENLYDAFTQACIEAQKAPIFYPACEDMFDDVYGMIGDYMDGYTVNQVCEGARMCR